MNWLKSVNRVISGTYISIVIALLVFWFYTYYCAYYFGNYKLLILMFLLCCRFNDYCGTKEQLFYRNPQDDCFWVLFVACRGLTMVSTSGNDSGWKVRLNVAVSLINHSTKTIYHPRRYLYQCCQLYYHFYWVIGLRLDTLMMLAT